VERDLGTGSIRAGIATSSTVATDPADFLVLASDGVWDVMENKDVARFLHTSARASANAAEFVALAQSLCCEAIILGSQDNITAMVVDLRYSGNGAKAATGAGPGVRPRGVTMKVEPM
jgi:serine/threonine protein phosphatase PrpC